MELLQKIGVFVMKKMFLKSSILALGILVANCANSEDVTVKLTGGFDFQAGYFKSNAPSKDQYVTDNKKHAAFNTSAYVAVEASNTLDNGFKYGAKIAVSPTTATSRKTQSGIYTESDIGRLELGTEKSAITKMRITPWSIASATGGLWDVWVKGDPAGEIPYLMNYGSFLDSKMRNPGKTEFSRKITYYTPELNGFQVGISYVPDSSNVGYTNFKDSTVVHTPIKTSYSYAVKDGFAGGVSYKKEFDEVSYAKVSVVGEIGKVITTPTADALAEAAKTKTQVPSIKPRNLKSYGLGGELTIDKYSVAVSYSDQMGSMFSSADTRKDSQIYGIGGRYKLDKFSASLTCIASAHRRNDIKAATLAADYKLAPGILPYAEITLFKARGAPVPTSTSTVTNAPKQTHKGFLLLLGTKVEF